MRAELAVLTAIAITTASGSEEAIKYTLWSRQCKLAKMLKRTSAAAAAQLESTRQNIRKLSESAKKLEIYVLAKPPAETGTATVALELAAHLEATEQLLKLAEQTDKAIKAVGYGHAGAAFITGFYQLLASNDNNNAYFLGNSQDNDNGAGEMTTLGCSATSDADFVAGPGPKTDELSATGFAWHTQISTGSGKGTANKC
uniref:Variant surface glycoprotein n=1 Tax=Trypanosoma brucei TaxID=5691 RepID=A0A1V0FYL2_9TRYP|nr:variant surface glycoprotein [Trypanosoma brucei]